MRPDPTDGLPEEPSGNGSPLHGRLDRDLPESHRPAADPTGADGPGPADAAPGLVVPDDASSLARDVEALRRERRALARRDRLRRLALGRHGGVGGGLVLALLLVVGSVAALPVVLAPDLPVDAPARPLARPVPPPGDVGGLLPTAVLDTPAGPLAARDSARPGVLALVPARCGCDDLVDQAVAQAREFTRNVRLVTDGRDPRARAESVRLRRAVAGGATRGATDPGGTLAQAYDARGVTLLAVGADGVVLDVLRDVQPGQRLEGRLMVLPDLR